MPEFKNYRFKDWEIKRQMRMIGTSELRNHNEVYKQCPYTPA